MVKISPTPPSPQPSEPSKPEQAKVHPHHRARQKEPNRSHKKQLQRFAKANPPPPSVEKAKAEFKKTQKPETPS
jgi:hypothetical protein